MRTKLTSVGDEFVMILDQGELDALGYTACPKRTLRQGHPHLGHR